MIPHFVGDALHGQNSSTPFDLSSIYLLSVVLSPLQASFNLAGTQRLAGRPLPLYLAIFSTGREWQPPNSIIDIK